MEEGVVELIDWPYESRNWDYWHQIQRKAIAEGIELAVEKTKWLAIIDTDEFILPMHGESLVKVLDNYADYDGVCVNWQRFGTSGVKKIPEDALMIETLMMRALKRKNFMIRTPIPKSL